MERNNDYTTGNLLDCEYFSRHYKLIVIDLSKQIESPTDNNGNLVNVSTNDSSSFKYKSSILGKATTAVGNDRLLL